MPPLPPLPPSACPPSQWPQLCYLAHDAASGEPCGVVVCKMEPHRGKQMRGYLAMLVVDKRWRGKGIGERGGGRRAGARPRVVGAQEQTGARAPPSTPTPTPTPIPTPAGSKLARVAIQAMIDGGAEEVALEAEVTNSGALALYRALGFIRDKRLHR
jgi:peptide alpha-N-acetyltransferase